MTTTQFPALLLNSYIVEIMGSEKHKNPLLLRNLSQKTKFNLRKLAEALKVEQKAINTQVMDLRTKYSDKTKDEKGQEQLVVREAETELFIKEVQEIEDMKISVAHYPFEEKDFIDKSTGEVVGAEGLYFNIIDILIFDKE